MHRTEGPDEILESGKRRYKETPTPATVVNKFSMNAIQEEICLAIENAGISLEPDGASDRAAGWGQLDEAIIARVAPANAHITSDGKSHVDVLLNNSHRTGNGSDHANVALNDTHRGSDGKNHSDVVLNNTHRGSDGSDHSLVSALNANWTEEDISTLLSVDIGSVSSATNSRFWWKMIGDMMFVKIYIDCTLSATNFTITIATGTLSAFYAQISSGMKFGCGGVELSSGGARQAMSVLYDTPTNKFNLSNSDASSLDNAPIIDASGFGHRN